MAKNSLGCWLLRPLDMSDFINLFEVSSNIFQQRSAIATLIVMSVRQIPHFAMYVICLGWNQVDSINALTRLYVLTSTTCRYWIWLHLDVSPRACNHLTIVAVQPSHLHSLVATRFFSRQREIIWGIIACTTWQAEHCTVNTSRQKRDVNQVHHRFPV